MNTNNKENFLNKTVIITGNAKSGKTKQVKKIIDLIMPSSITEFNYSNLTKKRLTDFIQDLHNSTTDKIVVYDDCAKQVMDLTEESQIIRDFVYSPRHSHATQIFTTQDSDLIPSSLQKNAGIFIDFTGEQAIAAI